MIGNTRDQIEPLPLVVEITNRHKTKINTILTSINKAFKESLESNKYQDANFAISKFSEQKLAPKPLRKLFVIWHSLSGIKDKTQEQDSVLDVLDKMLKQIWQEIVEAEKTQTRAAVEDSSPIPVLVHA
jgi:hypothetical protein